MFNRHMVFCLIALGAVSCARSHSSPPAQPAQAQSLPPHPTDCALDEKHFQDKSSLLSNDSMSVNIERQFQNVIHQDCKGQVVRSGIETVQSPTTIAHFKPSLSIGRVGAIRLFNDTACDWSTAILTENLAHYYFTDRLRGTVDGSLEITLDASKGMTSFHVKPGANLVYYTYYTQCVPDSERHTRIFEPCATTDEVSSGTFMINLNYSERTLPGDKIVHESCASEPGSR